MTQTTCHMSISLDGFVAGPDQDRDNPLGVGGRDVHLWHLGEITDPESPDFDADALRNSSAVSHRILVLF